LDAFEKQRAAEKIHELARQFRGRFLNSVAVIERDIVLILKEYSSRNCIPNEFKNTLHDAKSNNFTKFEKNIKALFEILKHDFDFYWNDYSYDLEHLDSIRRFRNKIAHSIIDVSDSALERPIEKGIGFVEWDKGVPMTEIQLNDWIVKANMVSSCLSDIKRLLGLQ